MPRPPLLAAVLLAPYLAACGGSRPLATEAPAEAEPEESPAPRPAVATAAVPAPVETVDQLRARLEGLRGKVVVVNLWASWCLPCAAEFPELDQIARDYRDRGVAVLAVSLDDPLVADTAVARFLAEKGPSFPVVIKARGPLDELKALLDPGWSGALPTTVLLDRGGRAAGRLEGARKAADFAAALTPLAGSPPPR